MITKAILLDIEGTTTRIDFVHKILFPFAQERVGNFVRENFANIAQEVSQLRTEHAADTGYSGPFDVNSPELVAAYLTFLIDRDRKSTPLKSIQGKIWQKGYESRELVSEIFEDVPRALKRWKSESIIVAIYSSGSVLAQKLLFRYSDHGDLTPFIDRYFDTNTGPKREPDSYRRMAVEMSLTPGEILFISDVVEELDAAKAANMQTLLAVRSDKSPVAENPGNVFITSFDEVI